MGTESSGRPFLKSGRFSHALPPVPSKPTALKNRVESAAYQQSSGLQSKFTLFFNILQPVKNHSNKKFMFDKP
jgi:hypothetical protein